MADSPSRQAATATGTTPGFPEADEPALDLPRLLLYGSGFYTALLVATYPMTVVKTRMQAAAVPLPVCGAIAQVRSSGWRGLYAGIIPALVGALPARAVYILVLEGVRPDARTVCESAGVHDITAASISNATAGFAAVFASQLTYCPVDVVTQRLMVTDPARGETALTVIRSIVASGWTGLYRGLGVSLAAYLPAGSVWWGAYGGAKAYFARLEASRLHPGAEQTLAAVWAALCTVSATSPLDMLKTRTQLATEGTAPPLAQTAARLYRDEGLRGFYRGFLPRWAHASIWGGAVIALYEQLKRVCVKR